MPAGGRHGFLSAVRREADHEAGLVRGPHAVRNVEVRDPDARNVRRHSEWMVDADERTCCVCGGEEVVGGALVAADGAFQRVRGLALSSALRQRERQVDLRLDRLGLRLT